jgi:hypothetical protein
MRSGCTVPYLLAIPWEEVLEQRVAGIAEACFEETVLCVLMVCEVRQLCCGGATKEA